MSSIMGETIKVSIFGQSHGEAIGVVIDGLPAGEEIDLALLQAFLDRRAPGRNRLSTPRKETDIPRFLSGLVDNRTCGAPLCAVLENGDARSKDYEFLRETPRPSHADYPAHIRYGGFQDVRGGGHFSGRLTAPLCVAGGIAHQLLTKRGVWVGAHVQAVGSVQDRPFEPVNLTPGEVLLPSIRSIPVLDERVAPAMEQEILAAAQALDSIGGIVECAAVGVPAGLGDPMFGGMENRLSAAMFGVPALRGIEFGTGFAAAAMRGSTHNDSYCIREGQVQTTTNHHGGILGGITTGMPLILRVAVKPTPSISQPQDTVALGSKRETSLEIKGRHDPCIALRAVPCVEAVTALVLLDTMLS